MLGNLPGREPTDPPAAGMRQLTYIAGTHASACVAAAALEAKPLIIVLIAGVGLIHAWSANRHGIKRGEQDMAVRMAEAAAASPGAQSPPPPDGEGQPPLTTDAEGSERAAAKDRKAPSRPSRPRSRA